MSAAVLERELARRRTGWRESMRLRDEEGKRLRPTLPALFAAGAGVVALLLVIGIVVGTLAVLGFNNARNAQLDQFAPVRDATEGLSFALLNQETGVRGFGLSGQDDFLVPYRDGLLAEQRDAEVIRSLIAENPEQADLARIGPALEELLASAQTWRTDYAETVIAQGGAAVTPEAGRLLFNDVRSGITALQTDVLDYRNASRAAVNNAQTFLVAVAVAVMVVLVAALVSAAYGLRHGVLRPVSHLAEEVRAVVGGDMTRSIAAEGPREIHQLAGDIEAMRLYILAELEQTQRSNRRLDEQARDLERSNRDLEQFAYVASHDLQEPLRKVSSFCQLLQRRYGGRLDERADQYIGFAVDGAQRMQHLINDLLAFSRVGRTTEGFEPVDLAAVASTAVSQLETARAYVDGTVEVGPLPTVSGDQALLRQMLVNLIGNGLKFHREGVPPVVRVSAELVDDQWELTVADNGIGIEDEYADKVFVIFQRLHARDVYPGTGIGLSLAKKIAEFHGGRIHIVPRDPGYPEPGATLRVELPASPEPPADAVPVPAAPESQETSA